MAQFGPFALVYVSMEPSAKTSPDRYPVNRWVFMHRRSPRKRYER